MLKRIEIRNFRSHEKSVLDFSHGINIIVGQSNSGKTNIFRAFNWLRTNRPKGARFISSFAKEKDVAFVKVVFEERGHEEYVSIKKSRKGSAIYSIGRDDKEIDSFEKVGFDVPDKIVEFLRIDNINLQAQLDQYFLITSSSGEIAREINRITNLEKVDGWIKKFTSKINSANREIKLRQEQIIGLKKNISEIPDLEKFNKLVEEAKEVDVGLEKVRKEKESLENILDDIDEMEEEIKNLRGFKKIGRAVDKAVALSEEIKNLDVDIDEMEGIVSSIFDCQKEEKEIKEKLAFSSIVEECLSLSETIKYFDEKISFISFSIDEIISIEGTLKEQQKEIDLSKESFSKEMKKLKKCPLCYSQISDKNIKEIMEAI